MCGMATTRIGTRIKRARERKRWTQQQLAGALNVNVKTVDNWENGRTSPRSSVGALEDILGVSLDVEPEGPLISPELRAMVEALDPDQREWVMGELEKADRKLRQRGEDSHPGTAGRHRHEAAG